MTVLCICKSTSAILIKIIVFLSTICSIYLIRSTMKPIQQLYSATSIADGNLNIELSYRSRDELGLLASNFNKTVTKLRDYVHYIDKIAIVLKKS